MRIVSTETRERMRQAALRRAPESAESRAKKSASLTGRIFSDEHRRKISDARKRQVFSPETLVKMSASAKARIARDGHRMTAKCIALGNAARIGKPISPHVIAAVIAAHKGKPLSPELRARLCIAQQKRRGTLGAPEERLRKKKIANFIRACVHRVGFHQSRRFKPYELDALIGYTRAELRAHLEAQFVSGMTWDNYGSVWSIDHIRPISLFVNEGITDPRIVNALTNLRPLWKMENHRKSNKAVA